MEAILKAISHFHALSIDKCMFCLQMPPVFFDSMKIFMFESNNRRRKHQADGRKKVVKISKFVQG